MIAKFFRFGSLPEDAQFLLRDEVVGVCIEHVFATVTFRDFSRGGWSYSAWKRQRFFGSLVISDRRLLAYRGSKRYINIPFDDDRFQVLRFDEPKPGILSIEHPAGLFRKSWSGIIEYRYPVDDVRSAIGMISRLRLAATRS